MFVVIRRPFLWYGEHVHCAVIGPFTHNIAASFKEEFLRIAPKAEVTLSNNPKRNENNPPEVTDDWIYEQIATHHTPHQVDCLMYKTMYETCMNGG
jgi:hypothetical protein